MKIFKTILFSLCLPALLLQPIPCFSQPKHIPVLYNEKGKEIFIPRDENGLINPWGYFDAKNMFSHQKGYINHYFDFTKLICDETFLETLSEEEVDRIIEFTVWVVRYSVPESRPDLKEEYEKDIEELYQLLEEAEDEEFYFSHHDSQFLPIQLTVSIQKPDIFLCKKKKGGLFNQIKRKVGHLCHWCDKHKKPLVIGAVAVGTVAAVVLTGGVGGSAVAAVGGGLVGSMDDVPNPEHVRKSGEVIFQEEYQNPLPTPPQNQFPHNSEVLSKFSSEENHIHERAPPSHQVEKNTALEDIYQEVAYEAEITKERILEETINEPIDDQDSSFIDKAIVVGKELSSKLAHGTVETVSEMSKSVAMLGGIAGQIVDRNYQESLQEHFYHSHEAIDDLFETDIGYLYSEQGKDEAKYIKEKLGIDVFENTQKDCALGEVLPPSLPLAAGSRAVIPKGGGAVGTAIFGSAIVGSHLPPVIPESVEQPITVYQSKNKETGEVDYVGITNNFERRFGEHWRKKEIFIEPIQGLENLSPKDARAAEQALIEIHGLQKNGGTLTNRINSISEKNPIKAEAVKRGLEILKEAEYDGLEGIVE